MTKHPWQEAEDYWLNFFTPAKGRHQPGSGNQPGKPGDTRFVERITFTFSDLVLLESKQTEKFSLAIREEWLKKIRLEALLLGRTPLLGLTIRDEHWLALPSSALTPQEE